jgi:hypothetical protein
MAATQAPWPARDDVTITGLRVVVTAPEGVNLVVVRIDTSGPGPHGLGCATSPVFGGHERWAARIGRPDGAIEAP